MKKYSIAFLIYAGLLSIAYYGSYRLTYEHYRQENEEHMEPVGEAVMADASDEPILKADTEYIIETYDRKTKEVSEIRMTIPTVLLGLDREETLEYIEAYEKDPGLEELEAGFEDMELSAFSSERVIFRKTYMPWEKEYKYSIGIAGGKIVVYYLDQKTVYEYTDIHPSDLPEDMQIQIRKGECRLDVHGLYEFLENYSS